VIQLPKEIKEILDYLKQHSDVSWDADGTFNNEITWRSPLGRLVKAFGECKTESVNYRRLEWLTMFAARRVLPVWELYCDTNKPRETIDLLQANLFLGKKSFQTRMNKPPIPSFRGRRINDCRASDTNCAGESVFYANKFSLTAESIYAVYSISLADMAVDQSPLANEDNFRKWFIETAIPIAYEQREMTVEEQNAYRTYNAEEIAEERGIS
jgi:hypothetical protein